MQGSQNGRRPVAPLTFGHYSSGDWVLEEDLPVVSEPYSQVMSWERVFVKVGNMNWIRLEIYGQVTTRGKIRCQLPIP